MASPAQGNASGRRHPDGRRKRKGLPLGTKLQIAAWKEAGKSWAWIRSQLAEDYSWTAIKSAYRDRVALRARLVEGARESSVTARGSAYPKVDSRLAEWVSAVRARTRRCMPISLSVLRTKALQIAYDLNLTTFSASNEFLQNWARRHDYVNVALHGAGSSAAVEEAAWRMARIREQLAGADPDLIYNVDETGLLYRCLPSRSYVPRLDRGVARGSKAMRSKDCVTLTLCCNATGSHKLPITMIGKAANPMCFNGEQNRCPLPYFSQHSAWTDGHVFKRWFFEVFVPGLRTRTASHVFLILDNLSCHSEIGHPQVTIIELPPNTTARYQPLDKGFIAATKRRYKTRYLGRVAAYLDRLIASGDPNPRVPRCGGLDQGGQAHLLDAARIVKEEWEQITPVQIANCWLSAEVLPAEADAEVRLQLHGVLPVADSVHTDVSEVVSLLANTGLVDDFVGVSEEERGRAVERWFVVENDVSTIAQEVDMVLAGEDED